MTTQRIWCRAWIKRVLPALIAMAFGIQTARGQTHSISCESVPIEFLGGSAEVSEIVCAAARQTVQVLDQCGIAIIGRIRVEIADTLDTQCGAPAYGSFDAASSTIKLASLSACIAHFPAGSSYSRLAPQLPLIARGIYYEGWRPSRTPRRVRSQDEFLQGIAAELAPHPIEAENAARDVFSLLAQAIDSGEIADVIGQLPTSIKELWPEGMRAWAAKRSKA